MDPEEGTQNFKEPFKILIKYKNHFEKLANVQRGLNSYTLFDASFSVPPLKKTFNYLIKRLQHTWKVAVFAHTSTG